jgi:hypothetical protein
MVGLCPRLQAAAWFDLSSWQEIDPLRLEYVAGVGQARLKVFRRQVVVLLKDLLSRSAPRQQVHHEFDGDPRAFDDGLSDQDLWINVDSVLPIHLRAPLSNHCYI